MSELKYTATQMNNVLSSSQEYYRNWKEAEKINKELRARISELSQAVGLITTLKPTMVMDADHPLDMAKEVEAYVTARIDELTEYIGSQMADVYTLKARIAELEEKQRWRVVADGELPEVYRDEDGEFIPFLVCENDKGCPYRALYDGLNWGDGMFVADVTHWMPLPELPESPNDTQTQTFVYGKESEE